jgi:ornithine cyclodeaminase/alanine dehydrogenase-like protein (mu-crystallin family)
VVVLSRADVEALLEPRELIEALARAFAEHAAARHVLRGQPRAEGSRAGRFASWWSGQLGLLVTVTRDADAAVARADMITCATRATTPLFDGRSLKPGAIESAGDLAIPIKEGVIAGAHVAGELADVVSGKVLGRARPDEITLFKSAGFALEDLVAARLTYTRAKARGVGREVSL